MKTRRRCVTEKKCGKRKYGIAEKIMEIALAAILPAGLLAGLPVQAGEAPAGAEPYAQKESVSDNNTPQNPPPEDGPDTPKHDEQEKPDPPRITSEPEDVQVEAGDYASFNVSAAGEELTYQWLVDKGDGVGFREVAGAVSELYRIMVFDGGMNGYAYKCEVTNEGGSVRTRAAKLTIFYKIVGGAQSVWVKASGRGLVFQGSGAYTAFSGVSVDGSRITAGEYNKGGSQTPFTEITLLRTYLETLNEGDHELEIVWSDGSAKTSFRIKPPAVNLSADVSGLGRAGAEGIGSSRAADGGEMEKTSSVGKEEAGQGEAERISENTVDSLSDNTVKPSSGTAADALTASRIFKKLPETEMKVTPGVRRTQERSADHEKRPMRLAAMSETIDRYARTICTAAILISAAGIVSGLIAYRMHDRGDRRNER